VTRNDDGQAIVEFALVLPVLLATAFAIVLVAERSLRPGSGFVLRLRLRALPRRVEYDRVVVAKLLGHQRTAEQVAGLSLDRL